MADLFWDRIEPHTRDPELEEGLQARLADPLWLMARQWQVGEFRGEDAASPIHIRATVQHHPLTGFRNDAALGSPTEPFPAGRPLESRVEAEGAAGHGRVAVAGEAGLQLLRRVDEEGLQKLRAPLRAAFRLTLPTDALRGLPERERRRLRRLARGSLDGLRALGEGRERVVGVAPAGDQAAMGRAVDAWREEQVSRFDRPGESGETWAEHRLEHRFSVTAEADKEHVLLSADGYPGGRLDWHAFDVAESVAVPQPPGPQPPGPLPPGPQPGPLPPGPLPPGATPLKVLDVLPVPLTYAGMPASSYWEVEDGVVYFGGVEAAAGDIARLVIAEFATVYSNDYFLFPVRLPAGSIARVTGLTVRNTFGESFGVRSAAELDEVATTAERPWAFFELSGDPSAARRQTPWLLLAPALPTPQNGPPLESVSFVRDEEANLAWAIEERLETASGKSVRRRLMTGLSDEPGPAGEAAPADEDAWRYRLQSPVPPYWIPLVPERPDPDSAQVRLRRARMLAWEELDDPTVAGPKGRLLAPDRPLWLHEEEIPQSGAQVTRRWQLARGADGRPHLWMARRKRPGRGERGSGLGYDSMDGVEAPTSHSSPGAGRTSAR